MDSLALTELAERYVSGSRGDLPADMPLRRKNERIDEPFPQLRAEYIIPIEGDGIYGLCGGR